MKKNISSRSHLFFLELIIVILLFALTSTLLLSVFIKADAIREKSKEQTHGMIAVQAVAERIKGGEELDITQFPLYYDADWKQIALEEEGTFVMEIDYQETETLSGTIQSISLEVSKTRVAKEEPIWQLAFKKYIPRYEGE